MAIGRVQHKWNATYGTGEKFLVGNEDAFFIDYTTIVNGNDPWIEFKHADGAGKNAGEAISWATHFSLNQNGDAAISGDLNVRGTIDAGNILLNGNPLTATASQWEDDGSGNLSYSAGTVSIGNDFEANNAIFETVVAKKLAAALNPQDFIWPDYVFAEGYELPSLSSVESFIKKRKTPSRSAFSLRSGKRRNRPG